MKKLFIVIFSILSLTIFAQQKKVAVYVTGEDAGINKVLGSRLVSAIARSNEFSAIERTESFLAELNKEQNYQHSGAVDDSDLSRLGKQFGVQYVCVAAVSDAFNEKYLSARLIDVESAQVERTASSSGSIQSLESLVTAANAVSSDLLSSLGRGKQSNLKKVAVYVVKNEAGRNIGRVLGDKLVAGFTNSGRYIAIERTNSFLAQLNKEQNYQHSGAVDDSDLSRLGKQFGVQYVCVADVSDVFGEKYISARLIDVETAEVVNTHDIGGEMNSMSGCLRMANDIAAILSNATLQEQAAEQKAEKDRIKAEKDTGRIENALGVNMKMIWVEGGSLLMGCTSEQGDCSEYDMEAHQVSVESFWISQYEITQSQWEKVMGTSASQMKNKQKDYNPNVSCRVDAQAPINYVSWDDAMEFCRRLSNATGKHFTLPTEDQWEYAARGGRKATNQTKFSGSNMIPEVACCIVHYIGTHNNDNLFPMQCGKLKPNALGIYDMSGNVNEWCLDWQDETHTRRALRGGSWRDTYCYIACRRFSNKPYIGRFTVGFRVVCIP